MIIFNFVIYFVLVIVLFFFFVYDECKAFSFQYYIINYYYYNFYLSKKMFCIIDKHVLKNFYQNFYLFICFSGQCHLNKLYPFMLLATRRIHQFGNILNIG